MRSHYLVTAIGTALVTLVGISTSLGADPELDKLKAGLEAQIEAQLASIRTNYESRIQQLETRIQALESDNKRLQATASKPAPSPSEAAKTQELAAMKSRIANLEMAAGKPAVELEKVAELEAANRESIQQLHATLTSGFTETRDLFRDDGGWPFDMKRIYDLPRPLEYHGYFRSGFGMNGEGGKMEAFRAPGAGAKYRLGNEADTYGELGLTYNWLREDDPLASPYVRAVTMLSYSTGENFSYDSLNNQMQGNDFALRQAYIEAGNVFESAPEIRVWGGQRYYRRHDIHINDFYYLDMSGYGGGIEDVPLGDFGKLAVAWLGGGVDSYTTDRGDAAKQNIDLRLYDIDVPLGKMSLWLDYSSTKGGEVRDVFNPDGTPFSIGSSTGWAAGLIHRTGEEQFLGGYNEFFVQYGSGAAYNFATSLDTSGPDIDKASRFRIGDHFTIQPSSNFALQTVAIYQDTKYGGPNSRETWTSFGLRPVVFFSDRFSLALEAGVDWADSQPMGTDGHLWKVTLAPQISRGGKFFSRPVIRPFITYAKWSDDFRGMIGGNAYENALDGLSYGLQVEAWW